MLLVGCSQALGPEYAVPEVGWEDQWLATANEREAGAQPVNAIQPEWWLIFRDPVLDDLVASVLAQNNNLKVAGLRVMESRARLRGAESGRLPQLVEATAATGRAGNADDFDGLTDNDFSFANAELSIGWELDFWGRFQRAIEASDAAYLEAIANFEDFKVLLVTEVVRQYFSLRTTQLRLAILEENAALQARSVDITQSRYEAGEDSELNVQQARAQYLATLSNRPVLQNDVNQALSALARLSGTALIDTRLEQEYPTTLAALPDGIAYEIPADLLRRRPDVRAAHFRAAAASAAVGVAQADLYPALSLFGSIGTNQTSAADVVSFTAGPALRWNIFDFGRIRNNVRVQDARFEQALTLYQETILGAAREVDDTAVAYRKLHEEIQILEQSEQIAQRAQEIALIHFQEGFSDFQRLLDAQATLLRQQDRLVAAKGLKIAAFTQLNKAMAGGWVTTSEEEFLSPVLKEKMESRTNWGGLLESGPAAPTSQSDNNQSETQF